MNIILICARGGSRGLKNKNIKLFHGKPLIYWTLKMAKQIKGFDEIIISTDSKKIRSICENYGFKILFLRPKSLAKDNSPEWRVETCSEICRKQIQKKVNKVLNLPVTS